MPVAAATLSSTNSWSVYFAIAGLSFVASVVLWMIAVTYHFYETNHPDSNSAWTFGVGGTVLFVASVVLSVLGVAHLHSSVFGSG